MNAHSDDSQEALKRLPCEPTPLLIAADAPAADGTSHVGRQGAR